MRLSIDSMAAWPVPGRALIAFAAGAIMVPAMPPWCLWPALFIGLSIFYIFLSTVRTTRAAFGYGWLFGFGYFVVGLSWIANALLVEGNEFAWVWPLAIAGLPALLSLFTAVACMLIVRFGMVDRLGGYLFFCATLMGFEWLRGHLFTGFPWNLYGYTWANTLEIAQIASIGGIYLLTLATCMWASLPGFLYVWRATPVWKVALALLLVIDMGGAYFYGAARLARHDTQMHSGVAVRAVQPNIPQADKWNPEKAGENLEKLLMLSAAGEISNFVHTIIVWPETALSGFWLNDPKAQNIIRAVLAGYNQPVMLLSGVMRAETDDDGNKKYYNSFIAFNQRLEPVSTYNKFHLVPFGEYIPLQRWLPLKPFVSFSGFEAGAGPQTFSLPGFGPQGVLTFSPLVCYEVIFPGQVTDDTDRPDFLVNVTNDAWYGDSAGPRQHFAMAQFRAIEEGIPVVRSANTGISGVIDPVGRIIQKAALNSAAGTDVALPQTLGNATLFTTLKDRVFLGTIAVLLAISFSFQAYRRLSKSH